MAQDTLRGFYINIFELSPKTKNIFEVIEILYYNKLK